MSFAHELLGRAKAKTFEDIDVAWTPADLGLRDASIAKHGRKLRPSRFDLRPCAVLVRDALLERLSLRTIEGLDFRFAVSGRFKIGKSISDRNG